MIIRQGPTEEEQRQLRRVHLLDYACLGAAILIVLLTAEEYLYGLGGLRAAEAILLLGAALNAGLAARAALGHVRAAALGALFLACFCAGGLLYLVLVK